MNDATTIIIIVTLCTLLAYIEFNKKDFNGYY